MRMDETLKHKINTVLKNQEFRNVVEADIGFVSKVQVIWEEEKVNFYGSRSAKSLTFEDMKPLFDQVRL